jgi:VWFA-related protein
MLAGGSLAAQTSTATPQAPATSTPTFRSRTQLLVVDVSALDRDGSPVPNLGARDFEVKLDGVVRPVKAVTYARLEGSDRAATVVDSGTKTVSNVALTSPQRRILVILVDDLSLAPWRGKSLLNAAARFVSALPDTDLVGLSTTSRTVNVNPTLDHGAIATAVPAIVGEYSDPRMLIGPPVGIEEAVAYRDGDTTAFQVAAARDCLIGEQPDRLAVVGNRCAEEVEHKMRTIGSLSENTATRQVEAYREVITAMAKAPGIKQLVLITDGVAVSRRSDGGAAQLEPIARAATASGVQLSVLTERMPTADVMDIDHALAGDGAIDATGVPNNKLRRGDDTWVRSGVQTIADLTGGIYYDIMGSPDRAFEDVTRASSAIYQLGIELPTEAQSTLDHSVSVRSLRPDVVARANRHALSPSAKADVVPTETQLQQAIVTGAPFYAVPLSIGTSLRRGDVGDQVNVDVDVDVPATVHGPVTVVFGLGDRGGMLKTGRTTIQQPKDGGDYRATLALPISPGIYRLRFAVSDGDDKVGSVETRLGAQLNKVGPFYTSDVLTGWSVADKPPQFMALERVPGQAENLLAAIELYPPVGERVPDDLKVRMTLMAADESSVAEVDVTPTTVDTTLRADSHFSLQGLTPGLYTLRATVLVRDRPLGSVSTTVRTSGAGTR